MGRDVSPRVIAAAIFAVAVAAIGGAWAYESLGYLPCELCYKERIPYYAAFVLAPLAGLAAQTGRAGLARATFLLLSLLFLADTALSIYHSGVEWKIFAGPSDCSGPLSSAASMDDFMKQLQTVKVVRCDTPTLWVLGLTLANWNVLISGALALLAAIGARGKAALSR
ncbi:disulfide bond formation protein B [Methylocystis echinoides]|uniref:Disulfide bond formation protein DsbB n=1 Tax=Methylocystis echinoides TaxID=29468 RepID=A0A9W6GUQ7_9HYPH|nr:disulfide bond formation protein B [Methylocystis echinoides]GLI93407.1 disulfide bond formation protein DsbB [Methylocystis echinoides]